MMKEYKIMVGAFGPSGSKTYLDKSWSASGEYIAYREPGGELIEAEGQFWFVNCTEERMYELMDMIKPYSIMRAIADFEGTFTVDKLLETDVIPSEDENAFCERYKIPITFNDEQFGTFVFDKGIKWYAGAVDYQGDSINVTLESEDDIKTLRFICKDMDGFIAKASRYAAKELLELGNQWLYEGTMDEGDNYEGMMDEDDNEVDFTPLTEDDFAKRIALNEISLDDTEDGGHYSLWFDDGDIFAGHSIRVSGSIESGFIEAVMEG